MRYVLAVLACVVVFVAYVLTGAAVFGWERGGGVIPMLILFAVVGAIWRKMTIRKTIESTSDTGRVESTGKSHCESDSTATTCETEMTGNSHKPNAEKTPAEEIVAHTKVVPENFEDEKQGVAAEQIGTVRIAQGEDRMGDAVTHSQPTEAVKEQSKWLLVALLFLAVVFIAIIYVARFSNTPAATRADIIKDDGFFNWQKENTKSLTADAYCIRGADYYRKGQYILAISDYTKAIEINPRWAEVYYFRGGAYNEIGQNVSAISDYTKAIEINPRYAEAYFGRGLVYCEEGARDLSIFDYTKAIEINPRYAEAYHNRGGEYWVKGQNVLAISDYTKAIEINPSSFQSHFLRGVAYVEEGAFDLAISDFNKAIEMNPRKGDIYYSRGFAYAKKGEFEKAWKDVQKAQGLGYQGNPEFIKNLRTGIVSGRELGKEM